jgi:hypothetical protein
MNISGNLRKVRCHGKVYNIGGDKKQSTSTSTQNVDSRSIITNTLDGGAIKGALDFASGVADSAAANTRDFIDGLTGATKTLAGTTQSLFDTAAQTISEQATKSNAGYQNLFDMALTSVTDMSKNSQKGYENLFDQALGFAGDATKSIGSAYDKASAAQASATGELKAAYADAKGTSDSQKQIILALLAVAAVAVAAPLLKGAH